MKTVSRLLLFSVLMFCCINTYSQKRRTTPAVPTFSNVDYKRAMDEYRFNDAEDMLTTQINALIKANLDPEKYETMLDNVRHAKSRLNATERVVFIDSVVVHKNEILPNIPLSDEAGKLDTYQNFFSSTDNPGAYLFRSQMGDHIIYAKNDAKQNPQLFEGRLFDDKWTEPKDLNTQGLGEHGDLAQNFPFLLSDGTTLYYAAKGEESLGGYDIFMTRFDTDDKSFLAPENIGMPFNSTANDYLYVVDEVNQLGWFVTDRNQHADSVCIYTFIPTDSRKIYSAAAEGERMRALAMLNSIRDTWTFQSVVSEAQARLADARKELIESKNEHKTVISFIINDNTVYTSLDQFKSAEARQQAQWWIEGNKDLNSLTDNLEEYRLRYSSAKGKEKDELGNSIRQLESQVRKLRSTLKEQLLKIRQLENI